MEKAHVGITFVYVHRTAGNTSRKGSTGARHRKHRPAWHMCTACRNAAMHEHPRPFSHLVDDHEVVILVHHVQGDGLRQSLQVRSYVSSA